MPTTACIADAEEHAVLPMRTKVVRIRVRDIERVAERSGLARRAPFALKLHCVLDELDRAVDPEVLRSIVREELAAWRARGEA